MVTPIDDVILPQYLMDLIKGAHRRPYQSRIPVGASGDFFTVNDNPYKAFTGSIDQDVFAGSSQIDRAIALYEFAMLRDGGSRGFKIRWALEPAIVDGPVAAVTGEPNYVQLIRRFTDGVITYDHPVTYAENETFEVSGTPTVPTEIGLGVWDFGSAVTIGDITASFGSLIPVRFIDDQNPVEYRDGFWRTRASGVIEVLPDVVLP